MPGSREELLYVAVDTQGCCRAISGEQLADSAFVNAIGGLGQLLEEGWQLVSENPPGQSESSIVILKRNG